MDLFFGTKLPKAVLDSFSKVSEELFEDTRLWGKTLEEAVEHLNQSTLDGKIYMAYKDGISLLFMDKTPYTVVLTILAPKGVNKNKIVRHINQTIALFKEKTDLHKIEIFTACPELHWVLSRCGFKLEGVLEDSRRIPTGEFVDEFCYGFLVDV